MRCLDMTLHLEEEAAGILIGLLAQQSGGGAKGGGKDLTTACFHEG
jgi:hypothetical protein